ncbi:hypothetical protein KI387_040125, partial [Taxus chinensis]
GYISFKNKDENLIIPVDEEKVTPYVKSLSEEEINRIYALTVQGPEIMDPSKE